MKPIALVDLDDTLFQTARKCPPAVRRDRLSPLAFARDGGPLGFATPRQMEYLRWLAETTVLIPVTARSLEALRRVHIGYRSAICAHGGAILDEAGRIDSRWHMRMGTAARSTAPVLDRLADAVRTSAGAAPLNVRVIGEDGIPLYLVVKHREADEEALATLVDPVLGDVPEGWTVHRNGNNVAFLPPFLGKHRAVAWLLPRLREHHGDVPVIGIGDSLTDAPFMALCDYAMIPSGSQLARATLGGDR